MRHLGAIAACLLLMGAAPPGETEDATPPTEEPAAEEQGEELPGGHFRIGAGYSTVEGFIVMAGLGHQSLFGVPGLKLGADAHLSATAFDTTMDFELGHEMLGDLRLALNAFYRRRDLTAGGSGLNAEDFGGALELGLRLGDGWSLTFGYRLESRTLENAHLLAEAPIPVPTDGLLSALRVGFAYHSGDGVDPGTLQPMGFHLEGGVEHAGAWAGSDFEFTRFDLRAHYGLALPEHLQLHFTVTGGLLLGDADRTPLSERYHLGGLLDPGSTLPLLGPRQAVGSDQVSLGGTGMLHGKIELDIPLWREGGLYAFVALEGGGLFHPGGDSKIKSSWGAGVSAGLLWNSPIGPMRAGVSIPFAADHGPGVGDPMFLFTLGLGF